MAVSDGASVSFDSGPWAGLLVEEFVARDEPIAHWLGDAAHRYGSSYDRDAMDWMQQGAFDLGSFASFLGIRPSQDGRGLDVTAVGDSLLAVLDSDALTLTFPYTSAEQFDASPRLLSTDVRHNRRDSTEPLILHQTIHHGSGSRRRYLLMTDALGHWLLSYPDRVPELLELTEMGIIEFVASERASGRLRRDDTTLLVCE